MKRLSIFQKRQSINRIAIEPNRLYEGCLLAAIAHAVTVGEYPELNYEHSWDGINYSMNNSQGCRGTISFDEHHIVAAFRDEAYIDETKNAYDFFRGADSKIKKLAQQETLQYLLADVNGVAKPLITSAFWGSWDACYSQQSFDDVMKFGGAIISTQLRNRKSALQIWDQSYVFHDGQRELILSLYEKKLAIGKQDSIHLSKEEVTCLYGEIDECIESLRELNMLISDQQ